MEFLVSKNNILLRSESELRFAKNLLMSQIEELKKINGKYKHGIVTLNPRLLSDIKEKGERLYLKF